MNCVVTLKQYAQALASSAGVRLCYEPTSAPQGTVFLRTTRCVLDTKKLEMLGWQPHYSLEEGIIDIMS